MLLSQLALRARRIHVVLNWENADLDRNLDLILVVRGNGGVDPGSAYAIHFATPAGPDGAIRHLGRTDAAVVTERAEIDLDALHVEGDQVVLSLSASGGRLADAPGLRLRLIDADDDSELLRIDVAAGPGDVVHVPGELYRRRDGWYYRTAGFGFADGLAELGSRYAVRIDDALYRRRTSAAEPAGSSGETPGQGRGVAPLGDVKLLPGARAAIGMPQSEITAELTWKRRDKDLDLYALYIDQTGRAGVCYYRNQGSLRRPPHICLTTGDRHRGRETIVIASPPAFRHILICAYSAVENGVGSFREFHAVVQVDDHAGSVVQTPLYHRNSFSYWVAIARIDLSGEEEAVIEHVENYSRSRSERRPVLHADGTFTMDAGPVEFKTR
jgi:stress response protein SCP2